MTAQKPVALGSGLVIIVYKIVVQNVDEVMEGYIGTRRLPARSAHCLKLNDASPIRKNDLIFDPKCQRFSP